MRRTAPKSLADLGYTDLPEALHVAGEPVPRTHPYALELRHLLEDEDAERVLGVFEVDGVPAVCLVVGDPTNEADVHAALRAQLWNQGLVSLLLVLGENAARAWPIPSKLAPAAIVTTSSLNRDSPYSAFGVRSGALRDAHPDWFEPERRIDRFLLRNLDAAVATLSGSRQYGFSLLDAQHLLAQVLFVAYLEDRGLINDAFLEKKRVKGFRTLLAAGDGEGLDDLLSALKDRFNGDFLETDAQRAKWADFPDGVLGLLHRFLAREDLTGKQPAFWGYNFRYVPVELLSAIYERFLQDQKKNDGAYYTPRHLANLVVEEAFRGIAQPHDQIIWDGACGSGILLTTAYRRMLASAEATATRPLCFYERTDLLKQHVFGGDINASACKVTAFSLYLCVFEDLVDTSLDKSLRLPQLVDRTIFGPDQHGDAFSPEHPIQTGQIPRPTIAISNPPWVEPKGMEARSFDDWAKKAEWKIPLRQIAVAYAARVCELAASGARICLVLPAGSFLRPTHHRFARRWLGMVRVRRLINFSDLRMLLFPGAKHPCVVVSAENAQPDPSALQLFEYLTPKADPALHYGRLTIYPSDRHVVLQSQIRENDATLRNLYWTSEYETAEVARLRLRGTLRGLYNTKRLLAATGFHPTDNSKDAIEPGWLVRVPYISADGMPRSGPVLPSDRIGKWPGYATVASRGPRELYRDARVIVPNGMTPDHRIRAYVTAQPGSFNASLFALRFADSNPDHARFLAAFLCSRLGAYLALMSAPSAVVERTQIKQREVLDLPFHLPEHAKDPDDALLCLNKIARWVASCEDQPLISPSTDLPDDIEALIHRYFGLSPMMSAIVQEAACYILPNMQPTTLGQLPSPLQAVPSTEELQHYAQAMVGELSRSRDVLRGTGAFSAQVRRWWGASGGLGIVAVQVHEKPVSHTVSVADAAADRVIGELERLGLLRGVVSGGLNQVGDVLIFEENRLYFAKPLARRLWLTTAAADDARRIVRHIQSSGAQ